MKKSNNRDMLFMLNRQRKDRDRARAAEPMQDARPDLAGHLDVVFRVGDQGAEVPSRITILHVAPMVHNASRLRGKRPR